ncbi:MAG TPA: FlgD immunoglobulin-like domain containing protein, partial [Candidatus Cloacimonadota bacterium]|nr:FlgD immunoglobulin-like domain containing protein [Candidatus Cloacimonadota bacterium]
GPAGGYPGLSPLPVSVDDPIVPALTRTAIKAYPNPFSTQATISFELKEAGACKLSLYDIKGRKVKQLMASSLSSGVHQFMFSAWDDKGNRLPSGRYLIGLEHNGLRHLKRITLSR